MSRCFAYPPPGYCRNGATHEALIESIKLQKETDKAKAERRKEKREKKDKKKIEKEKRKNDEKVKSQKDQSQDSHKLHKLAGSTEVQIKGTKANTEILEKSDLTEEHGQPLQPSYSSDSTQNSNKRRRDDDVVLPDDSTGHGKPFKIRLLKKHKGSDSSSSGQDGSLKTVPLVQPSNLDRTLLVSSTRNNGLPATSGRENNAPRGIPLTQINSSRGVPCVPLTQNNTSRGVPLTQNNTSQRVPLTQNNTSRGIPLTQTKSNTSLDKTITCNPNGSFGKPILPSGSRKSNVEVQKSSRQQIENFLRPVVPQSHLEHGSPSSYASRIIGVEGLIAGRQQKVPTNLKPAVPDSVLCKPSPSTTGKRPINEIAVPSSSGPPKLDTKTEDSKKAGLTRSEKKILKKQAKYEKLLGGWVPPVFHALLPDVDDDVNEDWLGRKTKTAKSSVSRVEGETCRDLSETSLWQPRARFLAEVDLHALPYTVPF